PRQPSLEPQEHTRPQGCRRPLRVKRIHYRRAVHSVVHSCRQGTKHLKSPRSFEKRHPSSALRGSRPWVSLSPECLPADKTKNRAADPSKRAESGSSRISKVSGSTQDRCLGRRIRLCCKRSIRVAAASRTFLDLPGYACFLAALFALRRQSP